MKHLLATLVCALQFVMAFAQPTITSGILPVKGDTILMAYDSTLVPPGPSGATASWDFSTSVHQDLPIQRIYLDPASTAYASKFPSAKLCRTDGIGSLYSYWDNTNTTKSVFYGFVEPGVYDQHYNNLPLSYYKFPIHYNDSFVDSVSAVTNPGAIVGPGKYYFHADGWGTLKLPAKTVSNVLRTKSIIYIGDSMPPINSYSISAEYAWYQEGHKEPLLVISSVVINHALHRKLVIYDKNSVTGLKEEMKTTVSISPNPFSTGFTLNLTGRGTAYIYDLAGRLRYETDFDASGGFTLNPPDLAPGLYQLHVVSGSQTMQARVLKE